MKREIGFEQIQRHQWKAQKTLDQMMMFSVPEATEEPLRPEIDIKSTKALPQKGCNFKSYKSKRNELTENPKTSLESSHRFAVF